MRTGAILAAAGAALLLAIAAAAPPLAGRASAQTWERLDLSGSPGPLPRRNASAVFDAPRRRIVIFGGATASGDTNDVWAFQLDSASWTDLTPPAGPRPAPRFAHTAVIDPATGRMIVWSGQGTQFFDDAWSFDPASPGWTLLSPTGTVPAARYGSAAAFDASRGRMLIFAGFTTAGRFEDVRALDPSAPSWADVTPGIPGPIERCLHSAAFDPAGDGFYVYAGQNAGFLDDLWRFDAAGGGWTNLTLPGRPSGRFFTATAFLGGRFIVFGGATAAGRVNDLWAFDPADSSWTPIAAPGATPSPRDGHAACVDPATGAFYVFGGSGDALLSEVWRLTLPVTGVGEGGPGDGGSGPAIPLRPELGNHPNPFNGSTVFSVTLPSAGEVRLELADLRGAVRAVLLEGRAGAGTTRVAFDASDLPSGVYFARLGGRGFSVVRKILLVR